MLKILRKNNIIDKEYFFLKEEEIIIIVAKIVLYRYIFAFRALANNEGEKMSDYRELTNFNEEINMDEDIYTTYNGKYLVLKDIYRYVGPITLQYLPYGGIQALFDHQIIINTKSGFIASRNVIYDGISMSSEEFISKHDNLVNTILPF